MVDDFVPWRRCWQLGYPTWNWVIQPVLCPRTSKTIQNPGHPSYKFLILFSHFLGCKNPGNAPWRNGFPWTWNISAITSCQKKNYIQTQLGCLTSKDIIEVEQYSTNSNPSNNLFSNYKSIYI
jgi:hypothetical protein